MYTPGGAFVTEVGDSDVIAHEGRLHLFHLVLPNHDLVAHVVSKDGLAWQSAEPALHTGAPGQCDDDMIWTMHTLADPKGGFRMYYTGCARAERGQVQRVALAFSDDLHTWRKHPGNPVLTAAGPFYNDDRDLVGFVSFRDPFVFIEDGIWHMLVTARQRQGPRFRRGCIAHATAHDGVRWELRPPLYAPGQFEDVEVPALIKIDESYYLFFHDFMGHTLYRRSAAIEGPWHTPPGDQLLPEQNFVFRFCRWQGRLLLFHNLRGTCDWPRRQRAGGVCALAPPKEVTVAGDGTLLLGSYRGWQDYHRDKPRNFAGGALLGSGAAAGETAGAFHLEGDELVGSAESQGLCVPAAGVVLDDFILEADVCLRQGRALGLLFRSDEALETANWLRLDFAAGRIELCKQVPYDSGLRRYKLQRTLIQAADALLPRGRAVRLRLLACGEYLEVSVDGVVRLNAVSYAAQRGRWGLMVEAGSAGFSRLCVQKLTLPWSL